LDISTAVSIYESYCSSKGFVAAAETSITSPPTPEATRMAIQTSTPITEIGGGQSNDCGSGSYDNASRVSINCGNKSNDGISSADVNTIIGIVVGVVTLLVTVLLLCA